MATALPYGDADWSKIEAMKYFMKTQEGMLVNQNTGEFETVTTANGTKTSRRRLLGYEVDTDGTQYRTTHGRKLLGNTCCKYYYDGQKTGPANEFSVAAESGGRTADQGSSGLIAKFWPVIFLWLINWGTCTLGSA